MPLIKSDCNELLKLHQCWHHMEARKCYNLHLSICSGTNEILCNVRNPVVIADELIYYKCTPMVLLMVIDMLMVLQGLVLVLVEGLVLIKVILFLKVQGLVEAEVAKFLTEQVQDLALVQLEVFLLLLAIHLVLVLYHERFSLI